MKKKMCRRIGETYPYLKSFKRKYPSTVAWRIKRHARIIEELPASLMGIGGAISGCGPAFMDLIIESYADAAVKYGISRQTAYKIVSQTMLGSAKLQLKTEAHPGILKDAVCSPGGTTIRGVDSLEKNGLRGICISSIDAIMKK